MQHMELTNQAYYEKRILLEIEEINSRIRDLTLEKIALQRQLVKAKADNSGVKNNVRKNSINRVMIETKVIESLEKAIKPMSTKALYKIGMVANFELKENTFRTHLHRMKKRGVIENGGNRGKWRIVAATAASIYDNR